MQLARQRCVPKQPACPVARRVKGDEGQRIRGGALGLGLLLGGATFSYGLCRGCAKAEILAINDDGGCEWGGGSSGGLVCGELHMLCAAPGTHQGCARLSVLAPCTARAARSCSPSPSPLPPLLQTTCTRGW